jgi:hypothetical protein
MTANRLCKTSQGTTALAMSATGKTIEKTFSDRERASMIVRRGGRPEFFQILQSPKIEKPSAPEIG